MHGCSGSDDVVCVCKNTCVGRGIGGTGGGPPGGYAGPCVIMTRVVPSVERTREEVTECVRAIIPTSHPSVGPFVLPTQHELVAMETRVTRRSRTASAEDRPRGPVVGDQSINSG